MTGAVKIIECPRDAMQGWSHFIPTAEKVAYINKLLKVGFDTIDFGSFVSPRAIPQMKDTALVLDQIDFSDSASKLLAIVANLRGAEEAVAFDQIQYLGYPFSVSETFQRRNANAGIADSLETVSRISELCSTHNKKLVVYISMAFGNPYGDPYAPEIVFNWVDKITKIGVDVISLADTVGLASATQVFELTHYVINHLALQEVGVHLHSGPDNWKEKLQAALDAGCLRFDGAINGIGGCPMAGDELVGNMNTEWMMRYFQSKGIQLLIDEPALGAASLYASKIFIQ